MVVARTYARALYEEAESGSNIESVDADVELIRSTLDGSPDLARFFRSPVISREKKESVVRTLFGDRVGRLTLRFLVMLVKKEREDHFPQIVDAYRAMRDEQLGIVEANARVAWDMDADERSELAEALGRLTGKRVRLNVEKDADLIGGLVIRIGDTVYDGSVRRQLEVLRDRMEVRSLSLN